MITPSGYKTRLIEKKLDEYMQVFGAICIEGPKYCGKTWTAKSRGNSAAFIHLLVIQPITFKLERLHRLVLFLF